MTTAQRKYLVSKIEDTYKNQVAELNELIKDRPKLDDYIIQAISNGTARVRTAKEVLSGLKEFVATEGKSSVMDTYWVSGNGRRNRYRKHDDDEVEKYSIRVPVEALFEIPEKFQRQIEHWERMKEDVDKQKQKLLAQRDTLVLQINIGSDKILDGIIGEVDALGNLSLFSERMQLLTSTMNANANDKSRRLGNGKTKSNASSK